MQKLRWNLLLVPSTISSEVFLHWVPRQLSNRFSAPYRRSDGWEQISLFGSHNSCEPQEALGVMGQEKIQRPKPVRYHRLFWDTAILVGGGRFLHGFFLYSFFCFDVPFGKWEGRRMCLGPSVLSQHLEEQDWGT
uniref:Uncharacterized protein n=1 Tax=Micrurus spixii TaxID=129469 RepID=A0A2D4L9X2_9SAUR